MIPTAYLAGSRQIEAAREFAAMWGVKVKLMVLTGDKRWMFEAFMLGVNETLRRFALRRNGQGRTGADRGGQGRTGADT